MSPGFVILAWIKDQSRAIFFPHGGDFPPSPWSRPGPADSVQDHRVRALLPSIARSQSKVHAGGRHWILALGKAQIGHLSISCLGWRTPKRQRPWSGSIGESAHLGRGGSSVSMVRAHSASDQREGPVEGTSRNQRLTETPIMVGAARAKHLLGAAISECRALSLPVNQLGIRPKL